MAATVSLPLLERARVATPCPARWEDMTGDDKVRHCALCNLDVHNFVAMEPAEADAILSRHFNPDGSAIAGAGRVCGMLARRADGTYLLQDCPVGLASLKAAVRNAWLRIAAAVGLLGAAAAALQSRDARGSEPFSNNRSGAIAIARSPAPALSDNEPFRSVWHLLRGKPVPVQIMTMGDMCITPPNPPVPTPGPTAAK